LTIPCNYDMVPQMNTKHRSIIQQQARGTYQRNQQIRKLFNNGANMAEIGRWFKLTRQAIRRIVSESGE